MQGCDHVKGVADDGSGTITTAAAPHTIALKTTLGATQSSLTTYKRSKDKPCNAEPPPFTFNMATLDADD